MSSFAQPVRVRKETCTVSMTQSQTKNATQQKRPEVTITYSTEPNSVNQQAKFRFVVMDQWQGYGYCISKEHFSDGQFQLQRQWLTIQQRDSAAVFSSGSNSNKPHGKPETYALFHEDEKYFVVPREYGYARWGRPAEDQSTLGEFMTPFNFLGTPIGLTKQEPQQITSINKILEQWDCPHLKIPLPPNHHSLQQKKTQSQQQRTIASYLQKTPSCSHTDTSNLGCESIDRTTDNVVPSSTTMSKKTLSTIQSGNTHHTSTAKTRSCILSLSCGFGKCWKRGTKFLMYNGSIKRIEDMVAGDVLMGDDSTPRTILSTTRGHGQMYKIVPSESAPSRGFYCNDEHILVLQLMQRPRIHHVKVNQELYHAFQVEWLVHDPQSNAIQSKTKHFYYPTGEYPDKQSAHAASRTFLSTVPNLVDEGFIWEVSVKDFLQYKSQIRSVSRMYMPGRIRFKDREGHFCKVLEQALGNVPTRDQVGAAAWFVGAWLSHGIITNATILLMQGRENNTALVLDKCERIATLLQCKLHKFWKEHGWHVTFTGNVHNRQRQHQQQGTLWNLLQRLGLWNQDKHIPNVMLLDDIETVRLPLLAGLLDMNGHHVIDDMSGDDALEDGHMQREFDYVFLHENKGMVKAVHRLANMTGLRSNGVEMANGTATTKMPYHWKTTIHQGSNPCDIPVVKNLHKAHLDSDSQQDGANVVSNDNRKGHHLVWSFEIEDAGMDDYYGFTVDGNQRMLLADCTVTHNTFCSLYLAWKMKRRTIVFLHRENLLDGWMEDIRTFMPNARVGIVQGAKCDYENKDIVLAMIQSVYQRQYPRSMFESFGMCIVDECHHICAKSFCRVMEKIPCRYVLGLSATPYRRDGLDHVLNWLLGPIAVLEKRVYDGVQCNIVRYTHGAQKEIKFGDKIQYAKMITRVCKEQARNELMAQICVDVWLHPQPLPARRKILFVSERGIEKHLALFERILLDRFRHDYLTEYPHHASRIHLVTVAHNKKEFRLSPHDDKDDDCHDNNIVSNNNSSMTTSTTSVTTVAAPKARNGRTTFPLHHEPQTEPDPPNNDVVVLFSVGILVGGMDKADRDVAKTCDVILSNFQTVEEGFNLPRLDTLILSVVFRNDIEQTKGRIERPHPDKNIPLIIEMIDGFSFFQSIGSSHVGYYRRMGYTVTEVRYHHGA